MRALPPDACGAGIGHGEGIRGQGCSHARLEGKRRVGSRGGGTSRLAGVPYVAPRRLQADAYSAQCLVQRGEQASGAFAWQPMKELWSNRLFRIGAIIALVGWTPLLAIVLLAAAGLWPDPNPNPIGPGLLFFFTFWPAAICLGIGAFQVWRRRGQRGGA